MRSGPTQHPEIRRKNLDVITRRFPALGRELCRFAPLPCRLASRRESTLLLDGIQLTSVHDRTREAAIQLDHIPTGTSELTLYGFGLGDLARQALARTGLLRLNVRVIAPQVSLASLLFEDQTDWLNDPRCNVSFLHDDEQITTPCAASPVELRWMPPPLQRHRDTLIDLLTRPYQQSHLKSIEESLQMRLTANSHYCAEDPDVRSCFGSRRGCRAFVVGAGSTLESMLPSLARLQGQKHTPIIAVNTALRPLLEANITPDYVVAIDHGHRMLAHFLPCDASRLVHSALVYFPTLMPEVLEWWPGRRLCAYGSHPRFDSLRKESPKASLFSSGTVLHPATALGVDLGASQVVLVGADFGYPHGHSHARGTAFVQQVSHRSSYTLQNRRGVAIPTEANFIAYLRDLEGHILSTPGTEFFQSSADSATIEGARLAPTQDWLSSIVTQKGIS